MPERATAGRSEQRRMTACAGTAPGSPSLLDVLQGFVHELRAAGLPVSMTENLDAMRAIEHIDIDDRDAVQGGARRHAGEAPPPPAGVRHRLRRLLLAVQHGVRSTATASADGEPATSTRPAAARARAAAAARATACRARSWPRCSSHALHEHGPRRSCAGSRRWRCTQFAGMEPGRPVGGTYYLYRTLRQLDLDDLAARLMGAARERGRGRRKASSPSASQREEFEARLQGAARARRGGDPPPARRRPRRRGDGAHAAQAACPRTSTSCTRRARRCSRCSRRSTR